MDEIMQVSILVLMDLPFLLRFQTIRQYILSWFQSLFLWIFRSYLKMKYIIEYGTFEVSILVLMDLPFLRASQSYNAKVWLCFNPCSYGSSVLTHFSRGSSLSYFFSFNPCSYGSSVLTKFQIQRMNLGNLSFNPCSYGSSVLTINLFVNKCIQEVSILVLMDLPFLRRFCYVLKSSLNSVSILVLMDLPFLHSRQCNR